MGKYWGKTRKFSGVCRHCGSAFLAADVKAKACWECLQPRSCRCGCGKMVTSQGCYYARGHHPPTPKSIAGHRRQAACMVGESNPAKRPEIRKKISDAVSKEHPSKTHKALWARLAAHGMSCQRNKRSKIERLVATVLPESFKAQFRVGPFYRIDYADPKRKLALEVNGCYWHGCGKCFPKRKGRTAQQEATVKNDRKKARYLRENGWSLRIVWEHMLTKDLAGTVRKALT